MEYAGLLTGTKWDILRELTRQPSSPLELSKKLKTSLPNILHQLSLLEAHSLVGKAKQHEKRPGKPKTTYTLAYQLCHISMLSTYKSQRKLIQTSKLDMLNYLSFHCLLLDNPDDSQLLMKFFMLNEDLIRMCDGIALFKTNPKEVELLVITEHLPEIRQKLSNQVIKTAGKERKVIVWSHNRFEIEDGLMRKDRHFTGFIDSLVPLYDKPGCLNILQKKE